MPGNILERSKKSWGYCAKILFDDIVKHGWRKRSGAPMLRE
jgi:hypothetical protein